MKKLSLSAGLVLHLFAMLGMVFFPVRIRFFEAGTGFADIVFGNTIKLIANGFFDISLLNAEVSSDSFSMYILVFILLVLAILISFWVSLVKIRHETIQKVMALIRTLFAYYLAFQLLRYGFDKVFKGQFYLPEPNILYTPFGKLDKDILFWSTMGTSYSYSFFSGLLELFAAGLIFIKRSRIIGLLLAIAILSNVVAINFSFDISVKLYSLFLLFLALLILSPQFSSIYRFFLSGKQSQLRSGQGLSLIKLSQPVKTTLKVFAIGLLTIEAAYPYVSKANYNDDAVSRPFLHGAYEVVSVKSENEKLEMSMWPVKRLFIHRSGYLIFQDMKDGMQDYHLQVDDLHHKFILEDYQLNRMELDFHLDKKFGSLTIEYEVGGKSIQVFMKSIDWRKLPVLQDNFHWSVDP